MKDLFSALSAAVSYPLVSLVEAVYGFAARSLKFIALISISRFRSGLRKNANLQVAHCLSLIAIYNLRRIPDTVFLCVRLRPVPIGSEYGSET